MTLHDHWLLLIGIAALYLYDSILLLFHNEIVLETRRSGVLVSGGSAMEFLGRHVFIPNPLCPHRSLARLQWSADDCRQTGRVRGRRRFGIALAAIVPWSWVLLALFFVVMPCVLLAASDALLLGWFVLVYLTILAMLFHVYRLRRVLNLSNAMVAALAFDVLLCAPFSINIIRKISLRQTQPVSLRRIAASLLSASEKADLLVILRDRVDTNLTFLEAGSAGSDAQLAFLRQFDQDKS